MMIVPKPRLSLSALSPTFRLSKTIVPRQVLLAFSITVSVKIWPVRVVKQYSRGILLTRPLLPLVLWEEHRLPAYTFHWPKVDVCMENTNFCSEQFCITSTTVPRICSNMPLLIFFNFRFRIFITLQSHIVFNNKINAQRHLLTR